MTVLAAPAGLVRVSAPLPIPRQYTLLDAAREVPAANDRWLMGQSSEGYVPGKASVFDHCSTGTDRVKDGANAIPIRHFGAFTVYLVGMCTASSIGPNPTFWTDRLQLAFEAVEAEAVERVFATADGNPDFGPYLNDANLKILDGTGVSPTEGLAQLEQEIADKGGGGIIHATPAVATFWASEYLISSKNGVMYTMLGTRVAVGAGYIDVATASGAGEEWAYATGPVEFTRDQDVVIPADYSQALDRSNNDVLYIAEREYVLNWVGRSDPSDEHHIQAGVLIDRTD
jgi:hypothetical protein